MDLNKHLVQEPISVDESEDDLCLVQRKTYSKTIQSNSKISNKRSDSRSTQSIVDFKMASTEHLADNYQLKWSHFSQYLHQCIAVSFKNEHFADVLLMTVDGRSLMSHRFILSACSEYLQQVLKFYPKITSVLPIAIVLPPEIDYGTMQTLLHYMYCGEATVSKNILGKVLRGGDILKIKGLWRPKEQNSNQQVRESSSSECKSNSRPPSSGQASTSSRDTIENDHQPAVDPLRVEITKDIPQPPKLQPIKALKAIGDRQNTVIKRTNDIKTNKTNCNALRPEASKDNGIQLLVIKEEPLEWSDVCETEIQITEDDPNLDIKPEIDIEESTVSSNMYTPLTCEICSETFTDPRNWVRHVQSHTDAMPAKRQRRGRCQSPESPQYPEPPLPPLLCDLCQEYFSTPGEWVQHIENVHTELELHMSNNNKKQTGKGSSPNANSTKSSRGLGPVSNFCSICSKKFPSQASLLIHSRTHTGEKPYMCEACAKGFNVKSNLLRHLRTVHDKIINSAEVEDSNDDNMSS